MIEGKEKLNFGMYISLICFACITSGEFLALTGTRLNGEELVAAGLATHYVPSEVDLCHILEHPGSVFINLAE